MLFRILERGFQSSTSRGGVPPLLSRLLPHPRPPPRRGYSKQKGTMAESTDNHITRVIFCGTYWPASYSYSREYLQSYPFIQVDEVPNDKVSSVIGKYHICVVRNQCLDSEIIARAKEMKLVMQFGVGLEGVDVDAATKHGIKVARIPGHMTGNSVSCAEMAIYLMLGLLRKQKEMEIVVKEKRLGEPTGETLFGKTVFILGCGAIGIDLAERLHPFGVKILATKRRWASTLHQSNDPNGRVPMASNETDAIDGVIDDKGGPEKIYDFAREADIIVTCLGMNPETAGIVDNKFLSSMKKGALLVNVARGGLLDYKAVLHHLQSGHLGGLGIDVAWSEPFDPTNPILRFPNVLITPHVAGVTEHSYRTMAKTFETFLSVHRKTRHLTTDPPNAKDAIYEDWLADDCIVISWLVNSMEEDISRGVMMLCLARKIWETLHNTYGHEKNIARICEFYDQLFTHRQG